MAETVVATTMTPVGRGLWLDTVDADVLQSENRAVAAGPGHTGRTRRLAKVGTPMDGLRIRIVDPGTGSALGERLVGEIQVTGSSLASGYHNDPEATAASRTADGWLRTGDLGYLADGELVITGRAKDVIILAGRNIYPDEVERAAARAAGVRPGNAVAFAYSRAGSLADEGLAVAVETREDDRGLVRRSVVSEVRAAIGLTPHHVEVLPPGTLPKTPSGKLQRGEARRLLAPTDLPAPVMTSQESTR
jgi:fatty-acyl-CoA synthase